MADNFAISYPKHKGIVAYPHTATKLTALVVIGTGAKKDRKIKGTLTPTVAGVAQAQIQGQRLGTFVVEGDKKRWAMLFVLPPASQMGPTDTGVLQVSGYKSDNTTPTGNSDTCNFTVQKRIVALAPAILGIGVTGVASGDDITAEASDFTVYGPITAGMIDTTTSLMNAVEASYVFCDPILLQFWCATFPPLAAGTYSLSVTTTDGTSTLTVTGLTVDQ
jgi:hypothetical protein